MGIAQEQADYAEYRVICERAMQHVCVSIQDYLSEIELSGQKSPISSISTRIKTYESAKEKSRRRGFKLTPTSIRENLKDVAGIRIITLYEDDVYKVAEAIETRLRLSTISVKDYIKKKKASGYRSLHIIVQREIFFEGKQQIVPVEIQIRTIAMDFWATIEHDLAYKKPSNPNIKKGFSDLADYLANIDDSIMELRDTNNPSKNLPI